MNVVNNTTKEHDVKCSFCNDSYPSMSIGEHLLQCGNKTEQCPNCEKYIQRAVFAYHYENKCANLEESPRQNRPPTASVSNSRHSELDTMTCLFCNMDCEVRDRLVHEANCIKNPSNLEKRKSQLANRTSDRDKQKDENATDTIPCDLCNQPIPISNYHGHSKLCTRQTRELQIPIKPQIPERPLVPASNVCRYCFTENPRFGMKMHENTCDFNDKPWRIVKMFKSDYRPSKASRQYGPNE